MPNIPEDTLSRIPPDLVGKIEDHVYEVEEAIRDALTTKKETSILLQCLERSNERLAHTLNAELALKKQVVIARKNDKKLAFAMGAIFIFFCVSGAFTYYTDAVQNKLIERVLAELNAIKQDLNVLKERAVVFDPHIFKEKQYGNEPGQSSKNK